MIMYDMICNLLKDYQQYFKHGHEFLGFPGHTTFLPNFGAQRTTLSLITYIVSLVEFYFLKSVIMDYFINFVQNVLFMKSSV